jgi:hypothetical protein
MTAESSSTHRIEWIQFVQGDGKNRRVLHRLVGNEAWCACIVESPIRTEDKSIGDNRQDFAIDLEVLIAEPQGRLDDDPWFDFAKNWCDSGTTRRTMRATLISLHGIDICWGNGRVAIRAPHDRLDTVRKAALEFAFAERELVELERCVNNGWDALEGDVPTAFTFREANVRDRAELATRFQKAIVLQAKLSRLIPLIVQPAQYPPTLESQLHERLKERMRQEDRVEVLERQLDIFQRVYEMCGQRSSDYMLTRSGNILEWIIILLLAVQTILTIIDYLPSTTIGT